MKGISSLDSFFTAIEAMFDFACSIGFVSRSPAGWLGLHQSIARQFAG
jgi:hypothetical protein